MYNHVGITFLVFERACIIARRREGSKSHPRGKQWLTVYRAHQVKIARPPAVRSALKPSLVGVDMYRFGWCAREVQENSVARA